MFIKTFLISTLVIYLGLFLGYFQHEQKLLIDSYSLIRKPYLHYIPNVIGEDNECIILLSFIAFMALGYIRGLKIVAMTLFIYHVPFQMLKGEYERHFNTSNNTFDIVNTATGAFVMILSIAELINAKPIMRKP